MKKIIIILLFSAIIMMPAWIRAVALRPWQSKTKKIVIIILAFIWGCFAFWVILTPFANQSSLTVWGARIMFLFFSVIVGISAYFSWPREEETK